MTTTVFAFLVLLTVAFGVYVLMKLRPTSRLPPQAKPPAQLPSQAKPPGYSSTPIYEPAPEQPVATPNPNRQLRW